MNGGVTARTPASALAQKGCVLRSADIDFTGLPVLNLGMTAKAEVDITFGEQLAVHGTVGVVANCASFTQRFMLKHKWPGLFAMTLSAILIQPRHGQAA
jgi:hypothetical protein